MADLPGRRAGSSSWVVAGFSSLGLQQRRVALVSLRLPRRRRAFVAPINEWYSWAPRPRMNPDIKVLLTLDKSNFPMGVNNVLNGGITSPTLT